MLILLICPICNKSHDTLRKISKHVQSNHNLVPKDVLFDAYPEIFSNCGFCGIKMKHYKTDSQSRKFCCKKCQISWCKTRKQSPETIAKRIENIDQSKKEKTRQNTMLEKYGEVFHFPDPKSRGEKISNSTKGKKHTEEHHKKVIESKRNNGNLNHTELTKLKISNSLSNYWNSDIDHCVTMPKQGRGGRGYKYGTYNGNYYRSSYELNFLKLCEKYDINVESAATKEFRIRYNFEGKNKYYYPDFYLPEYDVVVEIKPISLLDLPRNLEKIHAGAMSYNFWVVTEEELEESIFIYEVNNFEHIFSEQ
jgi:endogenous inhibitor of DNA gyrase (YacG/DUF329 family)